GFRETPAPGRSLPCPADALADTKRRQAEPVPAKPPDYGQSRNGSNPNIMSGCIPSTTPPVTLPPHVPTIHTFSSGWRDRTTGEPASAATLVYPDNSGS